MIRENINTELLDQVVGGTAEDHWYHYGITSKDSLLQNLRDVAAVVVAGSGERVEKFARAWADKRRAPIIALPKEERFVFRYVDKVIFSSHGMGMPSAAIALQELMKMVYFLKGGDLDALDRVLWLRVGTSGGLGVSSGGVVISTEGLQPDLKPYRVLSQGRECYFNSAFPEAAAVDIAAVAARLGIAAVRGKTVGCNDFYLEQGRRDGAISLISEREKDDWLRELYEHGVRNIEMETPMLAGFLNHWGFPRFAAICTVLWDRLQGESVSATPEECARYGENAETLLFAYLADIIP